MKFTKNCDVKYFIFHKVTSLDKALFSFWFFLTFPWLFLLPWLTAVVMAILCQIIMVDLMDVLFSCCVVVFNGKSGSHWNWLKRGGKDQRKCVKGMPFVVLFIFYLKEINYYFLSLKFNLWYRFGYIFIFTQRRCWIYLSEFIFLIYN